MISRGVEISIAGSGADDKDGRQLEPFSFFCSLFLFIIDYLLID